MKLNKLSTLLLPPAEVGGVTLDVNLHGRPQARVATGDMFHLAEADTAIGAVRILAERYEALATSLRDALNDDEFVRTLNSTGEKP